ncbi:hypothetical protein EAE99_002111 [Botrytis elliptica]|nr:hypothetical protein EAE99_002111 [Botrytis elliptica]
MCSKLSLPWYSLLSLTDHWIYQPPWDLNEYLPETLQYARQLGKGIYLEIIVYNTIRSAITTTSNAHQRIQRALKLLAEEANDHCGIPIALGL